MRPKFYPLLQRCVEEGVARGIQRAHKHTDNPPPETIERHAYEEVMNEIHEWFDFDQEQI